METSRGHRAWLEGGGEMDALVRAKDWSKTPLGPLESWSPALRTMTSILLANRLPMLLWWGQDSICIYNDAYIPVLGVKHPSALGSAVREVWTEVYEELRPLIVTPLSGGPSTCSEDLPLEIRRHDFLEETHWTVAYCPVPDETAPNGIGGVLATVHEITAQVVDRRRNSLLRDLEGAEAKTAEDVCAAAAAIFTRYPDDVAFARIYLLDRDERTARLVATSGGEEGPPSIDLSAPTSGWPIAEAVRTEAPQLVEDLSSRFVTPPRGRWPEPPERALVMPIRTNHAHHLAGALVVGLNPRLELDASYRGFAELATERLGTAIAADWIDTEPIALLDGHAEAAAGSTRVLVVEDNADMRYYLERLLRPLGTVEAVADGREALAAIERRLPDLVLSDVMTPDSDGVALVRALRDNPRTRTLPIVLLSAHAGEESRVADADLGVDDYIAKPFSARELVARVRSQLQLARQRSEYAEALFESDERFRALVTATFDVVYHMSADWSEMRLLVGRDFIEDTTDPNRAWLAQYIPPDDQAQVMAAIREAIRTKSTFELEHRVLRVDGTLGWTFSRAIPLLDRKGNLVEWFGAASDITTRKQAEEAVRTSEERYRTLFESIDEGFCVFDMIYDEAGNPVDYRFVEVNPAFEKHTGLVHADGKTIRELVPEHERYWFETYGKVAATGEPIRFEARGEGMHRWFDVYAFRLGQPQDRRVAAVFTDITDRKLAVEALRRSEQRFSTFFSRSGVAMSIVRFGDGRYTEVNEKWSELFGYRRDEVVGQTSIELSVPEQHDELYARLATEGAVRDLELVVRTRSGDDCIGLLSAQVVEVAGDKVIISSFVDITDRKRAEQALLDADRRKDEFLAVLSHELRNPLAPISNSLYILDHVPPTSDQAARAKQVIGRQVTQLSNLVNDLLDVTRIVSGKVQLQKERLDINEVVGRAVEDSRSLFDCAGVRLEFQPAPRPAFVMADRTRAAQIVGNLLHNSAKFTQAGGHTRASVIVDSTSAIIRVVDDGIGMSREMLARLFEPFAQAEQTLDRSKGGLGLGLALVKSLIELHGGTASAYSAGLGRGTEITVRLPLDTSAALPAHTPPDGSPVSARRRVLIIEDNADAADTLSEILAVHDNEVEVAYDGAAGVAKAHTLHPDVVLCDLGLPGMDGYEVARAVRADESLAGTFLVALSGYARPEDLLRATDAGFDCHLAKPVSLQKLIALLAEVH